MRNEKLINEYKNPSKERGFEVILQNGGDSVYVSEDLSFNDFDRLGLCNDGAERTETLKNHYNHDFINKYEIEIENDGVIYRAPLKDLVEGYPLYNYAKKHNWG